MIKAVAYFVSLSIGLLCLLWGFLITPVMAEQLPSPYIMSTEEFYNYYGDKFTDDQKSIINSLMSKFQPYLQADIDVEKKLAIDGYIPISPEFKELGSLWCNSSVFLEIPASATNPQCVFLNEKRKVVNVVWFHHKYDSAKIQTMLNNGILNEENYAIYKHESLLLKPTILAAFEQNDSVWHSHENVSIANLGTLNSQEIKLKQALFDNNWVNFLKQGLLNENAILANYEPNQHTATYPGFNQAIVDGVYMSQMWIGLGNPRGLLSKMHPEVSPQAVDILETFEKKYY